MKIEANSVSIRKIVFVGSSLKDLKSFPDPVQDHVGYVIFAAQLGGKHKDAKPLAGFGGSGVLEVVRDDRDDTFRTVTVRLPEDIYVLHAFQKKSKTGSETPQSDLNFIRQSLKEAEAMAR